MGVIAHKLAHINNRDTLIMTVTATIAGAISMIANFGVLFGGGDREGQPGNTLLGLLILILAPLAALPGLHNDRIARMVGSADERRIRACGESCACRQLARSDRRRAAWRNAARLCGSGSFSAEEKVALSP